MTYHEPVLIIHTSDWQIGMPARTMTEEARHRFRHDRVDAAERLLAEASSRGACCVIVAGDLFDDNTLSEDQIQRTLGVIARQQLPIVALPGNHDALEPHAILARDDLPDQLIVLDSWEPRTVVPGLEVVGAPWRSRIPGRNPAWDTVRALESYGPPPAGTVRVLVAHGQWERYDSVTTHSTLPADEIVAALDTGLIHYVALGDHHSYQIFVGGRVAFSGTHEVTAADERDPGWALAVTLEPSHPPAIERIRVGRWRILTLAETVTSADDVAAIAGRLRTLEDPARCVVRLHLDGTLPLAARLTLEQNLEAAAAALAGFELDVERVASLSDASIPADFHLRGAAATAFERLLDDPDPVSQAALRLLARLALEGNER
ncbi:metallophosphoesterase [Acidimicrobium ferrooxidans DSM 10331]|uniref:Metallophosphoesterase n=1 Tax=Acidimicrobium ferrooxidans (strain DSM 10331 / JCM 15462 / NBRC 103882 / ICP) TaxID=525909 RepID=C7M1U4_ACIFD|nr:metallophosphoesterase [Acidimicrobium ferrooxidans DSM 10331]